MAAFAPVVSIITPTYNHEAFIGSCIESVLAQGYPHWEMIVVDDGSTDATREIVGRYEDPRIRLIAQENKGIMRLSETYNTALEAAQGELVAILEGDDYWPPYKLEMQVPDFLDPALTLSSGFTAVVDGQGEFYQFTPPRLPSKSLLDNVPVGTAARVMMDPEKLTYTFPVATMVRTAALRTIGGFQQPPEVPLVDLPTFLRLTLEGPFRFRHDILGYWRRHGNSTTKSKLPIILETVYGHIFDFIRKYRDRIPMTDAELDALETHWQHFQAQLCMLRGRWLATRGNYALAARAFREIRLYRRSRKTGLACEIGAVLASLRLPSEWLFRAFGRGQLEELVVLGSGDQIVTEEDMTRPRPVHHWRQA